MGLLTFLRSVSESHDNLSWLAARGVLNVFCIVGGITIFTSLLTIRKQLAFVNLYKASNANLFDYQLCISVSGA